MEFFEVVQRRYSVRSYTNQPIPESVLQTILQAANAAPSAFNRQAYEIFVVRDTDRRRKIAEASWSQMFIAQAPVVLVFFANAARNREQLGASAELYSLQDAVIACTHAHLAAAAAGLGSCWIAAGDEPAMRNVCGAPDSWQLVAALPIGFAADQQPPRERRPLSDLVH